MIWEADDDQIKRNNSKRSTIRVGNIGCSGLVILNLSGGENTDKSFYWYFRFYKASKV